MRRHILIRQWASHMSRRNADVERHSLIEISSSETETSQRGIRYQPIPR